VIWRCHIGEELTNHESEQGWGFLSRYLADVPLSIFSRHAFIPPGLQDRRTDVIPPSIDPFSAKSEMLDEVTVRAVLERSGLVAGRAWEHPVEFTAADGTLRRVDRRAHVVSDDGLPAWESRLVIQVSRWDPLKDPIGVMDAFVRMPAVGAREDAYLMLVGPEVTGVADDPEAGSVLEATLNYWQALPGPAKRRIAIASLPTADPVENATIVNALQSHARVVVQKSLREGFGLTVTEAMWKAAPIVASRVGGVQDQIEDQVEGLLVDDPRDLEATSRAISLLLNDETLAARLGNSARSRAISDYLPPRHLLQYADLIERYLPMAG
jgi:trehalose synthase